MSMFGNINISHIATGGTIDSAWQPAKDTAVPCAESSVRDYFINAVRRFIGSKTLFLKDSRDLARADIQAIEEEVIYDQHLRRCTLVTSGTYQLPTIARGIAQRISNVRMNFPIVLTGSRIPLHGFESSDAGFNLGMSVATFESSHTPKVVVVMNGRVLDALSCEKDLTNATFFSRDGTDELDYESVTVVAAGGTIDFEPDGLDRISSGKHSKISRYLRENVAMDKYIEDSLTLLKDSRELNDSEIDEIVDAVRDSHCERVLITMGMYRMQEIAGKIRAALSTERDSQHHVAVTSSRLPLKMSGNTDAPFNLGYSMGKLGEDRSGVRVFAAGREFQPGEDHLTEIFHPDELQHILR